MLTGDKLSRGIWRELAVQEAKRSVRLAGVVEDEALKAYERAVQDRMDAVRELNEALWSFEQGPEVVGLGLQEVAG